MSLTRHLSRDQVSTLEVIFKLGPDADGVAIHQRLLTDHGLNFSFGRLYVIADSLAALGLATWREVALTREPKRPRKHYTITDAGMKAIGQSPKGENTA